MVAAIYCKRVELAKLQDRFRHRVDASSRGRRAR
jgi:hypothetical protein